MSWLVSGPWYLFLALGMAVGEIWRIAFRRRRIERLVAKNFIAQYHPATIQAVETAAMYHACANQVARRIGEWRPGRLIERGDEAFKVNEDFRAFLGKDRLHADES